MNSEEEYAFNLTTKKLSNKEKKVFKKCIENSAEMRMKLLREKLRKKLEERGHIIT